MGEQTKAALARLEKLTSAGMSPEKAADIAFKNIPKNFWPDRVVQEVIMYHARERRSRKKAAELQAQETQDLIDSVLDTEEKLSEKLETASEGIKALHEQLDPEKMEEQKKKAAELGKLGFKTLSQNAQSLLDSEQTEKVEEVLGQFAEDFEYATSAFGVLIKGAGHQVGNRCQETHRGNPGSEKTGGIQTQQSHLSGRRCLDRRRPRIG